MRFWYLVKQVIVQTSSVLIWSDISAIYSSCKKKLGIKLQLILSFMSPELKVTSVKMSEVITGLKHYQSPRESRTAPLHGATSTRAPQTGPLSPGPDPGPTPLSVDEWPKSCYVNLMFDSIERKQNLTNGWSVVLLKQSSPYLWIKLEFHTQVGSTFRGMIFPTRTIIL